MYFAVLMSITIIGWSPQIIYYINPQLIGIEPITAYTICAVCLIYYPLAITIFFKYIGPWMRTKYGRANTLRFWELFVSVAWQVQTIGFTSLTLADTPYLDLFDAIPAWTTNLVGFCLVGFGLASKGAAIYMTGYNTYYWYDMVLNTPNAYFVEGGIYKFCGSPTYTLGRFTGLGAAIKMKSIPLLYASIVDLILITLFNYFVEQPFVRKIYG